MFRGIMIVLLAVIVCAGLAFEGAAQQAPSSGAQSAGGRGRGPGAPSSPPSSPPLFFKETWKLMGPPHAIVPGEVVVTNPNLEFKMYGPSATASDPDKRIWISGPPGPVNIWTGMCTTPFAATLRDKDNYVDLTGLAKVRWTTRASGFHAVRPLIKLMDGTFLVGDHSDASTTCACRKVRAEPKRFSNASKGREVKNSLSIARGKRTQGFNSAISGNGEMRGNAVHVSFEDNHCSHPFQAARRS
jgi:hypothetical protein